MAKKSKKGGKKTGKKGKKGEKKKKEETMSRRAVANEKIWQARLRMMELTKTDFRSTAQSLATHNDILQSQMKQVELDTVDVISFLKIQDQKKEITIEKLAAELEKCKTQQEQERVALIADYSEQIKHLETEINKKHNDISLMQNELKHVKEFRKKRVAMQRELDEIKDMMLLADREHKNDVEKITKKFNDEKIAMQEETNQKISELADQAHQQAIRNLDEGTRSVYKENVRLIEALRFHRQEADRLKSENHELEVSNDKLAAEQEDMEHTVQDSVLNAQEQGQDIEQAELKIEALEKALNDLSQKFSSEQRSIAKASSIESESSQVELTKLSRLLQLKTVECARIRKLARSLLLKRTDLEIYFLESLNQMKELCAKNSNKTSSEVSVSDLPWELRELVLRSLFAKMNSLKSQKDKKTVANPVFETESDPENLQDRVKDETFLTQGDLLEIDSL